MAAPPGLQDLSADAVRALLQTRTLGWALHILEETDSTNTAALVLAQQGAGHGTVLAADRQTAGRGRLGRRWFSPPGENLYCSVILRRTPPGDHRRDDVSWLPLISAVAAARAIRTVTGLHPVLKWPNDVLIGERKVGGLLCEGGGASSQSAYVVVGVGINVNTRREAFPEDLRDLATSLRSETDRQVNRAALLASWLSELEGQCDALWAGRREEIGQEYTNLCSTLGHRVRISLAGGQVVEGLADSLGPDGSLKIKRDGGETGPLVEIHAGDVVHLR